MTNNKNKKSVSDYINQFGAYGVIITAFSLGFALSGTYWNSAITVLNSDLYTAREETNRVRQELLQVKSDYLTYRGATPNELSEINIDTPMSSTTSVDTKPTSFTDLTEERSISTETSYSFFNGDLTISLVGLAFEGDPLRHRIVANISSPHGEVVKIDRKDIGNVITYKAKSIYKITILGAETFSAKFRVDKLSSNDE